MINYFIIRIRFKTLKLFGHFFSKGCTVTQAAAWVGNIDGETSLVIGPVGDGGEAFGISQWHSDRIKEIKKGTGIDVRTAPLEQQLEAVYWEVTKGWYKTVWSKFIATTNSRKRHSRACFSITNSQDHRLATWLGARL